METARPSGERRPVDPDVLGRLTGREIQIIVLVARGNVDKQIARQLGIQITTIRSYIERIGRKTGRTRRADLTALAYELNLMGTGPSQAG